MTVDIKLNLPSQSADCDSELRDYTHNTIFSSLPVDNAFLLDADSIHLRTSSVKLLLVSHMNFIASYESFYKCRQTVIVTSRANSVRINIVFLAISGLCQLFVYIWKDDSKIL